MTRVTFDTSVLKIEGLETKFDVVPVSNSLAILIGDRDSASIVQQLHYWGLQGYGEVIDGVRWFYKPIKEWIEEVFPTLTSWKLGKMMKELEDRGIIRREKLFTKHQIQKGNRFWWQPKNQTYYYSLNTQKLQELADNFIQKNSSVRVDEVVNNVSSESAKTPENSVSTKTKILSNEEIQNTKDSDFLEIYTKNTSIENYSKDKSHPTLPSECDRSNSNNQDKGSFNTSELSNDLRKEENIDVDLEVIEEVSSSADVDKKINQNIDTTPDIGDSPKIPESSQFKEVSKPKLKTPKGTKPRRKDNAPWKDEGQFKRFYRALIQALPIVANSHSPAGLAQTIIRQLRSGIPHSYWDDFIAGLPIGTSTMPEWEVEPGVTYPAFFEYLTEKIKRGDNTQSNEQVRNEVFRILNQPRVAKGLWGEFKRSVVNAARQVERDRALGVSNPNTPVWTKERIEPSISEAATAGQKIMAVNGNAIGKIASADNPQLESEGQQQFKPIPDPWSDDDEPQPKNQPTLRELLNKRLGKRNLKGFMKQMPKVSKSEAEAEAKAELEAKQRQQMNRKTHISQMSVEEINKLLADPITRKELTPQIILNDKFDVVTDNLGEVLAVKINQEYRNNGGT